MAAKKKPEAGAITWHDLTVINAPLMRDFYRKVVGWKSEALDMGGYQDFCMNAPRSGKTVAGICHARGPNRGLPAQWLVYIQVANMKRSLAAVKRLGGKILHGPRDPGCGRMTVIRDPAGAVCMLYQAAK